MPRKKRFLVTLSQEERSYLQASVTAANAPARKVLHSRILLLADETNPAAITTDDQIAEMLGTSSKTVGRVRERYTKLGLPLAIERKEHSQYKPRRLDDTAQEQLLTLTQSEPPAGRKHWTLRLLADELVRRHVVNEISHETVRRHLRDLSIELGTIPHPAAHARRASATAAA